VRFTFRSQHAAVAGLAGFALLTAALLSVAVRFASRATPDAAGGIDQCRVTAGCVHQAPPPDPFLVPDELVVLEPPLARPAAESSQQRPDEAFVAVPERPPIAS